MTRRHAEPAAGQADLFGNPAPTPPEPAPGRAVSTVDSNDIDLMHTVASNAIRCGYLLVGASERVYARVEGHDHDVTRVPRYEEDAVHQLLRRRWLTLGAQHRAACGAASLVGTAVLVPTDTRARVERWHHLQRPSSWPHARDLATADPHAPAVTTDPDRVIQLRDRKRRR